MSQKLLFQVEEVRLDIQWNYGKKENISKVTSPLPCNSEPLRIICERYAETSMFCARAQSVDGE